MRGLRTRLLLLVLVAAVPVLAVVVASQIAQREQRRDEIAQELQQLASLKAAQLDRIIEGMKHSLLVLVRHPAILAQTSDECAGLLQAILDKMELVGGLAFATPEGNVFCVPGSDPDALRRAQALARGSYFKLAVSSGQATVGDLVEPVASDGVLLPLAQPLMPGADSVAAVALLSLRPEALRGLLAQARLPEGGMAGVLGPDYKLVARFPGDAVDIGERATFLPANGSPERVIAGRGYDGIERLYGLAPVVAARNLWVYVGVPRAQVFAAADRLFLRELALIGLAFLLAAGAAVVLGEVSIRRPIMRLRRAVAAVAEGDMAAGQVTTDSTTAQELADLAAAFGAMARRLAALLGEKDALLQQKDVLMREVDHRVKNSLAMVGSLLSLQARRSEEPAVKEQLREAIARVQAVAQVHGQLYGGDDASTVELGRYLKALFDQLCASAPGWQATVEAEPVAIPAQRAASLGILFSELVTNAFKHARPPQDRRRLETVLRVDGDGLVLSVRDFGVGLPADFSLEQARNSLGIQVITSMARNLKGELIVENAAPGARWVLRAPM